MSTRIRDKMQGLLEFLRLYRSKSSAALGDQNASVAAKLWQRIRSDDSKGLLSCGMGRLAGPNFVHAAAAAAARGGFKVDGTRGHNGKSPRPPSSKPSSPPGGRFPNWEKLFLGSVFSLLLAFWTPKWTTLLEIGGEAEVVINEVEEVAELVEKGATVVEKVSEEVADTHPSNNKIKEAALTVERISKEAAKDAQIAQEIIHKIDAAKENLEDVGEIVDPVIENVGYHHDKSKKTT
ncbi:hypothetical protein Cgig2_000590 [Carnegiea gigantea]|uniref:Uncharacterized protein n=1 Tax=Carnegiea gigantea TaxID=171969 RepID=A0A9Q1GQ31_9CARY|nr:hypothetical protein Cgig2_000590 [Carnegiea gigantea]